MTASASTAAQRWADELGAWTVPEEILAGAPESPWGFPTALFRHDPSVHATGADSPSRRRAREALGAGGDVLDVGSGGGAGSLPLVPPATGVTAVDESVEMLAEFAAAAAALGVAHEEVRGRWPDIAADVRPADVVVCHHVFYNVPDLPAFVQALDAHARRRVVVELTAAHPLVDLNPLWRHFHGLDRPEGPTAADALAVVCGLVAHPQVERFEQPSRWASDLGAYRAFVRRRLCLPPEREPEVAALLPPPEPRRLVTLWWDTAH